MPLSSRMPKSGFLTTRLINLLSFIKVTIYPSQRIANTQLTLQTFDESNQGTKHALMGLCRYIIWPKWLNMVQNVTM